MASLRLLRPFTLPQQLTPARFDLLYQLHLTRYRSPFQYRLAEWLGVTRATICKMIRGLRELGIVELRVDQKGVHYRRIQLTRFGRKCFARALKSVRRGRVDAAVRSAWRTLELSRRASRSIVGDLIFAALRYCRGLEEHTELYRYD
ncbi:MAG: hypothetical protein ACRELY_08785 [Polyangiaceae bacterium]